jgi:hypothetical protein
MGWWCFCDCIPSDPESLPSDSPPWSVVVDADATAAAADVTNDVVVACGGRVVGVLGVAVGKLIGMFFPCQTFYIRHGDPQLGDPGLAPLAFGVQVLLFLQFSMVL